MMKANGMDSRISRSTFKQHGFATLLILLLVAIAISMAIFGTLRYVQGTQDQSMALNAQSRAQVVAWSGVELLFLYFHQLSNPSSGLQLNDIRDLIENSPTINLGDNTENLEAIIAGAFPNPNDPNEYWVTINITGISEAGSRAQATTTVQVVYAIKEEPLSGSGGGPNPPAVITFNRDLRLGGNINVQSTTGEKYVINVKGVLNATSGNSITGVDTINATDSIHIGSGSSFNTLNSNGDIKLTGSVSGDGNLAARGNICLIGGTSANGQVKANGFVYGDGSASFGDIQAIGVSTYQGANKLCTANELRDNQNRLFAINMAGDNAIRSVKAKASVRFNSGTVSTNPGVQAQGNLRDTNWGGRQIGTISGVIEASGNNNPQVAQDISIDPSLQVNISPLLDFNVSAPSFDAYDYETAANYVFKVNASGYKVVTVRNISGIPDGTYYIGSYSTAHKDRLCTGLTANSTPTNPTCNQPANGTNSYPLCWGYSDWNTCFSYAANTKTWTINGISIAQGIAWFEGNVSIGNGTYYNTFIATGNISTAGSHRNYAPNYAGYSGTADGAIYAPKGICSNAISPHYPTQLCKPDSTYNPDGSGGIGNYAFMAGSVQNGNYVGGNIALGSSTISYGNVLAGNEFNSGGSTTIYGYITALGGGAVTYNSMGGSTTIIVNQLPPTYIPIGGTSIGGCTGNNCGGGTKLSTRVLWTRYL